MNLSPPMPCSEVAARLWEYLDGELDPLTTARVWDHLRRCERCFPAYDFQRAFRGFLRRQTTNAVPPGVRRKVFEALLREGMQGEGVAPEEWHLVEGTDASRSGD